MDRRNKNKEWVWPVPQEWRGDVSKCRARPTMFTGFHVRLSKLLEQVRGKFSVGNNEFEKVRSTFKWNRS